MSAQAQVNLDRPLLRLVVAGRGDCPLMHRKSTTERPKCPNPGNIR